MTARYGRVRCPRCKAWYGLDETHTCASSNLYLDAAMVAAFPDHPMVGAGHMPAVACPDDCEHRVWPLTSAQHAERMAAYQREVERRVA